MASVVNHTDYYRRALGALNLSNRDLACLLTAARHDGQATSQATVSRWMTGATSMDPGVLLYLTSRLQGIAHVAVRRPVRTQVIGVGGGKGGTGGSTLAVALAMTAHDCGYRTVHVSSHPAACNNSLFLTVLPRGIRRSGLPGDAAGFRDANADFVFVDMHRDMVREHAAGKGAGGGPMLNAIDLFVTPFDISSAVEVWAIADMCRALDELGRGNRMLVHMSESIRLFDFDCFLENMAHWKHMLYEEALPKFSDGPFAEPATMSLARLPHAGFRTQDIRYRYWRLFADILGRVGLDAEEKVAAGRMDFFSLVDLVSPVPATAKP